MIHFRRTLWLVLGLSGSVLAAPQVWHEPDTGMSFVALPKGCFRMGTAKPVAPEESVAFRHLAYTANLAADEAPEHEVCVDAFWIGQYEVRADEWLTVMGEPPPFGNGQSPAGGVSWTAAQVFATRLSEKSGGKYHFRLPSEAEWEYACKAGRKKPPLLDRYTQRDVAWYSNYPIHLSQAREVGKLKANAWGLYDMLGNVWEWVEDGYRADAYVGHRLFNPLVPLKPGGERVMRGGSYRSEYYQMRCANRSAYAADDALKQIGLRLVRQP